MNSMDRKIDRKPWWRRNGYWLIGASVASVILFVLIGFPAGKTYRVSNKYMTFETVIVDTFVDFTNVTGTIEPGKVIYIDAVEGGRVEDILIEEGISVTQGQPLIVLSNNNLMLEISNNEALVARAINDLRTARLQMEMNAMQMQNGIVRLQSDLFLLRRDFHNNEAFYKEQLISEDEFLKSKEAYITALKQIQLLRETYKRDSIYRNIQVNTLEESARQMEENQKYIRRRLDNLTVKSPEDGELASIDIEEGEVITYGMRKGKINIIDTYKIKAKIDEHYISQIHKGLVGKCEFRDFLFDAVITKIYTEVENGFFEVILSFSDSLNYDFHIGQTCRIALELGQAKEAILIPKGPFFHYTGGQWIFVVDPDGSNAQKRYIQMGKQNPEYFEVLSGLSADERVITSGYESFEEATTLIFK